MLVKLALFSIVALVKLAQVSLFQVCPFQVGFWFYRILLTITIRYSHDSSHDSLPPYNLVTIASYLTSNSNN